MSVRSEKVDVPTAGMASIDLTAQSTAIASSDHVSATIAAAQQADSALSETNTLSVSNPDHPITRNISVTIRATLGDLCLRKGKASWAPTSTALKNMFQKKKFTTLGGSAEGTGDLRSVVLHDMTATHISSDFPFPVGANLCAVDAKTYSITGEAFGFVAPSNSSTNVCTRLQSDDTSLAYEFARKASLFLLVSACFSTPSPHLLHTFSTLACRVGRVGRVGRVAKLLTHVFVRVFSQFPGCEMPRIKLNFLYSCADNFFIRVRPQTPLRT